MIVSGDKGGAFRAAQNLASTLGQNKDLCIGWTGSQQILDKNIQLIELNDGLFHILQSKVITFIQKIITKKKYGILSFKSITRINFSRIKEFNPDVIHIHNWFNVVSIKDFRELSLIAPIVFTMHDQRLITGGCHITYECNNYQDNCKNCPAVVNFKNLVKNSFQKSNLLIGQIEKYSIICPTNWTKKKITGTTIWRNSLEVAVIPNIVESNLKLPKNEFQVDSSVLNIRFIAANIDEHAKGFDILLAALELFVQRSRVKVHLDVFGLGEKIVNTPFTINYHGYIKGITNFKYQTKDCVTIVPSRMDNAPTTVLESQLEKSFVIATNVGGIPDLIENGVTGLLCEPLSESICSAILEYQAMDIGNRNIIIDNAYNKTRLLLSEQQIIEDHLMVYNNLKKNK